MRRIPVSVTLTELNAMCQIWRDYSDYADADEDKATRKNRQKLAKTMFAFLHENGMFDRESVL